MQQDIQHNRNIILNTKILSEKKHIKANLPPVVMDVQDTYIYTFTSYNLPPAQCFPNFWQWNSFFHKHIAEPRIPKKRNPEK